MRTATSWASTGRALAEALLDLALPSSCAGCGDSTGPLCPSCEEDLRDGLFERPRQCWPDPVPADLPPVTACGEYAGTVRRLLTAYKDDDRRDLRPVLAGLLAESLTSTLLRAPRIRPLLVPVPSSRVATRRRGDHPVGDLTRAAARLTAARPAVLPALAPVRRLADQSRLGQQARAENLAGAYAVRPSYLGAVAGRGVLLVDDVVTTGATLAEAARAVRAAGGTAIGAATVAATRRRLREGRGAGVRGPPAAD